MRARAHVRYGAMLTCCLQVNRAMQKFMFTLLQEEDHTARRSLKVVVELYKRKARAHVTVCGTACVQALTL